MANTQFAYVEKGFGQVEPNHLSAQRTGQIYAQLPAATGTTILENGQFVRYDYAKGEVNTSGAGEWMLVYNEVKVYRDYQGDKDFAMLADNYGALVYSPITGAYVKDNEGEDVIAGPNWASAITAADPYEVDSTATPMRDKVFGGPALMHGGYDYDVNDELKTNFVTGINDAKTMVPRVLKTNIGDIFTTNAINATAANVKTAFESEAGAFLAPNSQGLLSLVNADAEGMKWQIVKMYTMPDGQRGVKIMRIA